MGSFLPWERAGGFLGDATHGIRVDLVNFKYWAAGLHALPIYDHGGALVIFLTLVVVLLAFQPPRWITNPKLWNLIVSAILMASSLFFVGKWLFHRLEYGDTVEQPTLMIGLICVVLGAAILLWRAVISYPIYRHPQNAG